ncbi:hypothetical protein [Amycolatopsis sp. H20-H5]|uniref:hypothetical protein n=1 Tax=Amycolatopsis sp. H20-H5 TaxID=3046309 RepID=UPI002DBACA4B|nr:hypothetical protein [Amycolatopsis sp. H20-H5]MEC3974502.1 hypothetical protein [Amycolatopsis sp. H20-H5]
MSAEAGIATPSATWEELVTDGRKLIKPTRASGLSLQTGQVTENSHHAAILGAQQGANLFTQDGKPQLASDPSVMERIRLPERDHVVAIVWPAVYRAPT